MATKKISQLETISDSNLSGEAILPVVVSDPLIPNRKAKVNQLFKGVSQGTKAEPGLTFDLDRDTGIYQNAYDQIGVAFGDGGLYCTRLDNGNSSTSLYVNAVDDVANNTDIVFAPKGTGSVKVTGQFLIEDGSFVLEDTQGPRARFEVGNVGTGNSIRVFTFPTITQGNGTTIIGDDTTQTLTNKTILIDEDNFVLEDSQGPKIRFEVGGVGTGTSTRIMTFPQITQGSGTTIVGSDTTQTLTNKTILIDEDNFVLVDGTEEAIFQINWAITNATRRSYFLPDAGTVTTAGEPTATSSTLLDTKAEQTTLNKTLVNPKFAANADSATNWVQWSAAGLTANRTINIPDLSLTLVGTDTTQVLTNKSIGGLIMQDTTDITRKINFDLSNQNSLTNTPFQYPSTGNLNNSSGAVVSTIVTELATQQLQNKTLFTPIIREEGVTGSVQFSVENLTGPRVIKFPDADATLLSTENVTLDDVNFGAGIGAANLTSRTRLQQFFYAGF